MKTNSIENIIKLHLAKYPAMEITDMLKMLYQSEFGSDQPENPTLSNEQLLEELKALPNTEGSVCEDLGDGLCRVYLGQLLNIFPDKTIASRIITAISSESIAFFRGTLEGYFEKLVIFLILIAQNKLSDISSLSDKNWANSYSLVSQYISDHKKAGCPIPCHSESYKEKYQSVYCVVLKEFARYLDLFQSIEAKAKEKSRIIIAIDGKCGSGKSTLAKIISSVYNCPVIRADDFFLPGDLRSEERLTMPGGNIHYERFLEEIITPLAQGKNNFSYKVFDCHAMDYTPSPKEISFSNIAVIEGSYSMRPEFREVYDISVFLDAGQAAQKNRITARGGELVYEMFEQKWIPLENRYFEHFNIAENCNIVYEAD